MKVLVSTFGGDDDSKVLSAMRHLPYEKLVLVGDPSTADSDGFRRIKELEEMSGHEVRLEPVRAEGFMEAVDEVCEVLLRLSRDASSGRHDEVVINISGGPKLLGNAALFSAFRLGLEAYNCEGKVTKLPVLRGATAVDRFTSQETRFIGAIGGGWIMFDELVSALQPIGRQGAERLLRILRKEGMVETDVRAGKIHVALTAEGREVAGVLKSSRNQKNAGRRA